MGEYYEKEKTQTICIYNGDFNFNGWKAGYARQKDMRHGQQDSAGIAQGIATEIIRFHVRANSDSEADQQLKLQVKDRVVTYMEPLLRESQDIEQSRQI